MSFSKIINIFLFAMITSVSINVSAITQTQAYDPAGRNPPSECEKGKIFGVCTAQPLSTRFYCDGTTTTSLYAYGPSASASCTNYNYQEVWDTLCASVMVGGIKDTRTVDQKQSGCCPPQIAGSCSPHAIGKNGEGSVCIDSSVNLQSGNLYFSQDVGILTLSYNSTYGALGPLGFKWTHNYNLKVTALSDNVTLLLQNDDGNASYFRLSNGVYYSELSSGDNSSIIKNANGTYTRTTQTGTIYEFDTAGKVTSIKDNNGNTTTVAYSGSNLTNIIDPNGRTTSFTITSNKISTITDSVGRTYTLLIPTIFSLRSRIRKVMSGNSHTTVLGECLPKKIPSIGRSPTPMIHAEGFNSYRSGKQGQNHEL
jgi:YD repeat-containing protein